MIKYKLKGRIYAIYFSDLRVFERKRENKNNERIEAGSCVFT